MINIEEEKRQEPQQPDAAEDCGTVNEETEAGAEEARTADDEETAAEDVAEEEANAEEAAGPEAEPSGGTDDQAQGAAAKEPQEDESTRYMRLMADFQNYKKRVEKEKADLYQYANEKIVTELLMVVDNFERALEQDAGAEGFKEGMELIFKQLTDVLERSGLSEIPALGEDFDPNFHNAVMTEASEEYSSGKVSGVLQKGYTLNGKVIRPSMVKVVG